MQIVTFDPRYRDPFKILNFEWITAHFRVEPKDTEQVENPESCIAGGGEIFLLSNTRLEPAIALYHKHGYVTTRRGPHPHYDRCNIEMTKSL